MDIDEPKREGGATGEAPDGGAPKAAKEPGSHVLENPARVVPLQERFVEMVSGSR